MRFNWENQEERVARYMKIPPRKKLEMLRLMNEFAASTRPKSYRKIWVELRERRGVR